MLLCIYKDCVHWWVRTCLWQIEKTIFKCKSLLCFLLLLQFKKAEKINFIQFHLQLLPWQHQTEQLSYLIHHLYFFGLMLRGGDMAIVFFSENHLLTNSSKSNVNSSKDLVVAFCPNVCTSPRQRPSNLNMARDPIV